VDERLNDNRFPLHSVLGEIQETDCGDLADLTPLVAELANLSFMGAATRLGETKPTSLGNSAARDMEILQHDE
jgi:hypothetical protein